MFLVTISFFFLWGGGRSANGVKGRVRGVKGKNGKARPRKTNIKRLSLNIATSSFY